MDLSWVVRARWRLVGAWMWPAFVVLAVADGVIGHALPLGGDSQSVVGGIVLGLILNLVMIVVVAWPLAKLLRLRRRDIPFAIARNYTGTAGIVAVTLGLLTIGIGHHAAIDSDHATMRDAEVRAAAWIGDHAPAPYRATAAHLSAVAIQPGTMYYACATDAAGRSFCVVVNEKRGSVQPAGSASAKNLEPYLN